MAEAKLAVAAAERGANEAASEAEAAALAAGRGFYDPAAAPLSPTTATDGLAAEGSRRDEIGPLSASQRVGESSASQEALEPEGSRDPALAHPSASASVSVVAAPGHSAPGAGGAEALVASLLFPTKPTDEASDDAAPSPGTSEQSPLLRQRSEAGAVVSFGGAVVPDAAAAVVEVSDSSPMDSDRGLVRGGYSEAHGTSASFKTAEGGSSEGVSPDLSPPTADGSLYSQVWRPFVIHLSLFFYHPACANIRARARSKAQPSLLASTRHSTPLLPSRRLSAPRVRTGWDGGRAQIGLSGTPPTQLHSVTVLLCLSLVAAAVVGRSSSGVSAENLVEDLKARTGGLSGAIKASMKRAVPPSLALPVRESLRRPRLHPLCLSASLPQGLQGRVKACSAAVTQQGSALAAATSACHRHEQDAASLSARAASLDSQLAAARAEVARQAQVLSKGGDDLALTRGQLMVALADLETCNADLAAARGTILGLQEVSETGFWIWGPLWMVLITKAVLICKRNSAVALLKSCCVWPHAQALALERSERRAEVERLSAELANAERRDVDEQERQAKVQEQR